VPGPYYTLDDLNYPYGEPSPDSYAGRIPGSIQNNPTVAEQLGAFAKPIYDYGSMPAKAYVDEVNTAGQNLADFASSPNYADLASGLTRTAMLAGAPLTGLGLLGGSYAGAAALDAISPTPARAMSEEAAMKQLKAMPKDELKALQREMGISADGVAGRGTLGAYMRHLRKAEEAKKNDVAIQTGIAREQAAAEVEKERIRQEAANAKANAEREALTGRVDEAKTALTGDLLAARTPKQDNSWIGQLNAKLGRSIVPLVVGGVAGGVTKFAPKTGSTFIDDYFNPIMAGAEAGASTELAPLAATASSTETDPSYSAWERYMTRLPIEATDEVARAKERLSQLSPVPREVTDARSLINDYGYRGSAMLRGGVAGLGGATVTKGLLGAPETLAYTAGRVPGALARGYREGFKGAPKPRTPKSKSPLSDAADKVSGMGKPGGANTEVYKTYASAPAEVKDHLYQRVQRDLIEGRTTTAAELKAEMKAKGIEVPITQKRINETRDRMDKALFGQIASGSIRDKATLGLGGAFAAGSLLDDEGY
jgi:hypothetical protein